MNKEQLARKLPRLALDYARVSVRVDELEAFLRVLIEQTDPACGDIRHLIPDIHRRAKRVLSGK